MGLIFLLISIIILVVTVAGLPGRMVTGTKKIAFLGCMALLVLYYLFAGYLLFIGMFNLTYLEMVLPVLIAVLLMIIVKTSKRKTKTQKN
ncbi:MAG TPA: hypothetical protein VIK89_00075 [Cytophagaceae bacterium]